MRVGIVVREADYFSRGEDLDQGPGVQAETSLGKANPRT